MLVRFDYPRALDNFIEDFFVTDSLPSRTSVPVVDITESEKETIVIAELPGVKKEDIKINFENNTLTLEAERVPYEISENSRVLLNEVRARKYNRSIQFENEFDAAKISAELTNGVLRIVLPKTESTIARTIEVK